MKTSAHSYELQQATFQTTVLQSPQSITTVLMAMGLALLVAACSGSSEDPPPVTKNTPSGFNACLTAKAKYVNDNLGVRGTSAYTARAIKGGALYDTWWAALGEDAPAAINADNPLWDSRLTNQNQNTGPDTWRCKECHGWDYKGADGAYGSGGHYTGFTGLMSASGDTAIDLFCTITAGTVDTPEHQFNAGTTGGIFTDEQALDLTAFIKAGSAAPGLIDTDQYIDTNSNTVKDGNVSAGQTIYTTTAGCGSSTCHRLDGTLNADDNPSIGDVAMEDPYEIMHLIRFGHPGSLPVMPAFAAAPYNMSMTDVKNVIAYTATLAIGGSGGGTNTDYEACLTDKTAYVIANLGTGTALTTRAIKGGALYDTWWDALNVAAPSATNTDHPLWAQRTGTTNLSTGAATWRCEGCHGWDYKGSAGAYGSGSADYTGFPGIMAANSKTPTQVFCSIIAGTMNSPDHKFNAALTNNVLTDDEVLNLTAFITDSSYALGNPVLTGLVDTDTYFSSVDNSVIGGDIAAGQTIYTTTAGCGSSTCHLADGSQNADDNPSIGDVAVEDPFEVMHLIRFGHPGSSPVMPAFVAAPYNMTITNIKNVIAYTATLASGSGTPPPVSDAVTMVLGGKLYDHWPDETGVTPPGDNPLWAKQSTNTRTGVETWRCKECHGWDYMGKDGAYGPTSDHYTGFIGIYDATQIASLDKTYFVDRITNGFFDITLGKTVHNYGQYLGADNVDALATFIMNGGVIDTSPYISSGGNARGNATNGETLYTFVNFSIPRANCSACHGTDGRMVNFGTPTAPEYLGDLALENPWEVLHKARFGYPGPASNMPGMIESNFTIQDSVDVLTYTQKLNALFP